jgi:hypothetical protein
VNDSIAISILKHVDERAKVLNLKEVNRIYKGISFDEEKYFVADYAHEGKRGLRASGATHLTSTIAVYQHRFRSDSLRVSVIDGVPAC